MDARNVNIKNAEGIANRYGGGFEVFYDKWETWGSSITVKVEKHHIQELELLLKNEGFFICTQNGKTIRKEDVVNASSFKKGERVFPLQIERDTETFEYTVNNTTKTYINESRKVIARISMDDHGDNFYLIYLIENQDYALALTNKIGPIVKQTIQDTSQRINLLCSDEDGFRLKKIKLGEFENIKRKYPQSFYTVNKHIIKELQKKKQGIVLLHGEPGTGKTSYIRYLTSVVDRDFIIVPPNLIEQLATPAFVSFMVDNTDKVLIVEDAENAVASRDRSVHSSVGELLNLSDGLIGQAINCAVICTFNTDIKNIDDALLRPGRLIAEHKFGKLSPEEAKKLFKKLKKPIPENLNNPMSIAEIYNYSKEKFVEKKQVQTIGFQRSKLTTV